MDYRRVARCRSVDENAAFGKDRGYAPHCESLVLGRGTPELRSVILAVCVGAAVRAEGKYAAGLGRRLRDYLAAGILLPGEGAVSLRKRIEPAVLAADIDIAVALCNASREPYAPPVIILVLVIEIRAPYRGSGYPVDGVDISVAVGGKDVLGVDCRGEERVPGAAS